MSQSVQYIVDDHGVRRSVIVPVTKWEKLQDDYRKLQNKLDVFTAVREGVAEVKAAKKHGGELQLLTDFLKRRRQNKNTLLK